MTFDGKLQEALNIILENILTLVVYTYVDEVAEFIVYSYADIDQEFFRKTEESIFFNLGIKCEIVDFREFDENDKLEIISTAQLMYAESEIIQMVFEAAAFEGIEQLVENKLNAIKRKNETGTYYLS